MVPLPLSDPQDNTSHGISHFNNYLSIDFVPTGRHGTDGPEKRMVSSRMWLRVKSGKQTGRRHIAVSGLETLPSPLFPSGGL